MGCWRLSSAKSAKSVECGHSLYSSVFASTAGSPARSAEPADAPDAAMAAEEMARAMVQEPGMALEKGMGVGPRKAPDAMGARFASDRCVPHATSASGCMPVGACTW